MQKLNLLSKLAGNRPPMSRPLPTPSPIPAEYPSEERPWVNQRATPQQLQEWGVNPDDFMVGGGRMNFAAGGAKPIAGGSGSTIQAGSSAAASATPTVKPKIKLPVAGGVQKAGSLLREMLKAAYTSLNGEWGRPTGVRQQRENPYQTMEARRERAGQMANHIQQTYTAPPPIGTQDNMPSMPKAPSPFLRDKEYGEASRASDYVMQLRNARQQADIAQGFNANPQALRQVNQSYQTQGHSPQAQQAYGNMTQGANRAANYVQAKQQLLQKNPNLANADHADNKEFISSLKSTYGDNYKQHMENNPQELMKHYDKFTATQAQNAESRRAATREALPYGAPLSASEAANPVPPPKVIPVGSTMPPMDRSRVNHDGLWKYDTLGSPARLNVNGEQITDQHAVDNQEVRNSSAPQPVAAGTDPDFVPDENNQGDPNYGKPPAPASNNVAAPAQPPASNFQPIKSTAFSTPAKLDIGTGGGAPTQPNINVPAPHPIQPSKTASHEDYEQIWQGVFDQLRKEGANEDFLMGMMKEAFDLNGFVQPIANAIKPVGDYLKGLSNPTDITGEPTNRHQIIPNVDNRLLGGILGAGGGLGLANLLGMDEGAGKFIFPAIGGLLGSGGLSSAMNHWKDQPGFGHNKVPLLTASQYRANPLVDASSAVKN